MSVEPNWLGTVIGAAIVVVIGYVRDQFLKAKVADTAAKVDTTAATVQQHGQDIERLKTHTKCPPAPHEKHVGTAEQIHRSLRVEQALHAKHPHK